VDTGRPLRDEVRVKLAVCAEQWLFASALATTLDQHGYDVVETTDQPGHLLDAAARSHPDVCLLDVMTGPSSVRDLITRLRELSPESRVVLLADSPAEQAWEAYDGGRADGLVNKTCDFRTLLRTVERVQTGERVATGWPISERRTSGSSVGTLTGRELEVLRLVVQGYTTQRMADSLGVSRHTIRTHVQQILRKLDVHGRGKIARAALTAGLVDADALTGQLRR
jgi:DNA-binding NarL/FixJ family response regulator